MGLGRLTDPRARGTSPSVKGAEVSAGQSGQHEVRQEPGGAGEGRFWRGAGGGEGREVLAGLGRGGGHGRTQKCPPLSKLWLLGPAH